jgi:hypothetical protein
MSEKPMTEEEIEKDRKLTRLLNAAENWCGSYLAVQRSNEEMPQAIGVHMYNKAALQDALDEYPRVDSDDAIKKEKE